MAGKDTLREGNESYPIVSPLGRLMGYVPDKVDAYAAGERLLTAYSFVIDQENKVVGHIRAAEKVPFGGRFLGVFGEHVEARDIEVGQRRQKSYALAAQRGLREELGLSVPLERLVPLHDHAFRVNPRDSLAGKRGFPLVYPQMQMYFGVRINALANDLEFDTDEVDSIYPISTGDVRAVMGSDEEVVLIPFGSQQYAQGFARRVVNALDKFITDLPEVTPDMPLIEVVRRGNSEESKKTA